MGDITAVSRMRSSTVHDDDRKVIEISTGATAMSSVSFIASDRYCRRRRFMDL